MIYKGDFGHSSQLYTDIENQSDISKKLQNYFDQNFFGELPQSSSRLVTVIHGPYSQPHLVRIDNGNRENTKPLKDLKGDIIQTTDNSQFVGIPKSNTIYNDILVDRIKSNYQTLGMINPQLEPREETYGDFQPVQIFKGIDKDGFGLDPKLFLHSFLSQVAVDKKNSNLSAKPIVVLHTDFAYFISEGNLDKIDESLEYINQLAMDLNLQITIENNEISKNRVFQDAVPWGIDPEEIAQKVIKFKNLGVCLDIKHCLVNGYNIDEIRRKVMMMKSLGIPIVIHSRNSFVGDPTHRELLNYIFENAIPLAFEP